MPSSISRRDALKYLATGIASSSVLACKTSLNEDKEANQPVLRSPVKDTWSNTHDRLWLGGEYWANPMENWRISGGAAECVSTGGNRSIHSLTHQIVAPEQAFSLSVVIKKTLSGKVDGGASLKVGIRSELNEVKSNVFATSGINAGVLGNELVLGKKRLEFSKLINQNPLRLTLSGHKKNDFVQLTLVVAVENTGEQLAQLIDYVSPEDLLGNVAVVSNFTLNPYKAAPKSGTLYQFSEWTMDGKAFSNMPEQKFGPILWTMYTLSDSRSEQGFVLKLSALTGPMGNENNQDVELQILKQGEWQSVGNASLDNDAWVATFKVANWQEKEATKYRVLYRENHLDGTVTTDIWTGEIKSNPTDRRLKMAALTCQNDYGFPYAPVADNIVKLNPDLVYFSGDQIYESHGGFGIIRAPAKDSIVNYLRKYYQFGWAFREAMKNAPTIVLPDDHDVLQGNLWGDGGKPMNKPPLNDFNADKWGGFIQPVQMINAVHRTHTAHHPDPIDPKPTDSGINVYYTEMIYGDVSFAIIADRIWKSGPEKLDIGVGKTGENEAPEYFNPEFDSADLHLLGERQEQFLTKWAKDWRNHTLKAVLSQTVFAGISTHQPNLNNYIKYDFDSSGWPASARNRTIDIMRESKALHICGDTHLGTISQYGVHKQRDSNWAFCTPAISAGWPRWWLPDNIGLEHANRPAHGMEQTGEYRDSFGNLIYVYAVANPEIGQSSHRYVKAHEKGSGFGLIYFDTQQKTYTAEAYRFLIDVSDGAKDNMFAGWPVTIHMDENAGDNRIA